MNKIKVFIADDSSLIRNILKTYFNKTKMIELVDTAVDGQDAVEKLEKLYITNAMVDVIVLDVIMPKLTGLEALKIIRITNKKTPIIMFSSLTSDENTNHTVEALTNGANDYCQKPAGFGGTSLSADESIKILIDKIKVLAIGNMRPRNFSPFTDSSLPSTNTLVNKNFDLILIGCSTGGPAALKEILSDLPAILPPILITQHMPANFTKVLAKNLDQLENINVNEAKVGDTLQYGQALLAPGDFHMLLTKYEMNNYIVDLNQSEPVNSCRPAIDVLFNSVAKNYPGKILLIVLTGMGQDGFEGCKNIKNKRNVTIVIQNKETCTVWGMPAAIYDAKLYDQCLSLTEIKKLLNNIAYENLTKKQL